MKEPEILTFPDFAKKYCSRQDCTVQNLENVLRLQKQQYNPDGWMMLECQVMDSSLFGSLVILPYGPRNSWKQVPQIPVSPRGLASDTSVVIAILPNQLF